MLKLDFDVLPSRAENAILKTSFRNLVAIASLAAAYMVFGKLGLRLAFVHPSSTAVWPPAGIVLAAFLLFGFRIWPGAFLGAFLVNLTTAGTVWTSLGIATGNTLEGLLGAYLVLRFANGSKCFESAQNTFKFAIYAGLLSTMVAATIGFGSLWLGGYASLSELRPIWLTWWLGDGVGDVVIAPLLILWFMDHRVRWRWAQLAEMLALIASLTLVSEIVFDQVSFAAARNYPLEYLCIPFLIWAAFRFTQREAASVTVLLSAAAIWGTLQGFGPFAIGTKNESLLLLQSFMGIVAVMTIALAALSAERRSIEERALNLSVTDPLTGLANYRRLTDTLDLEIKRSQRSGRPFAILLFDLDQLKQINDTHGHLAGSRALCRLADILRVYCRSIDMAARYGGDEFAVVIPEARKEDARQVAARICDRIAEDSERPTLSVSVGLSFYPDDGDTMDALFAAADRALYQMKRQPWRESARRSSQDNDANR